MFLKTRSLAFYMFLQCAGNHFLFCRHGILQTHVPPAAASWWPRQFTISCCRITVWHRPENHFLQEVTLSELQHSVVSYLMAWIYFIAYSFFIPSYTICNIFLYIVFPHLYFNVLTSTKSINSYYTIYLGVWNKWSSIELDYNIFIKF